MRSSSRCLVRLSSHARANGLTCHVNLQHTLWAVVCKGAGLICSGIVIELILVIMQCIRYLD